MLEPRLFREGTVCCMPKLFVEPDRETYTHGSRLTISCVHEKPRNRACHMICKQFFRLAGVNNSFRGWWRLLGLGTPHTGTQLATPAVPCLKPYLQAGFNQPSLDM